MTKVQKGNFTKTGNSPTREADLITSKMHVLVWKDLRQFFHKGGQEAVRTVDYWVDRAVVTVRITSRITRC